MIHEFFTTIIDWYMGNVNYFTIALLMAIESTFIPLPSELVIPPAAWKAAQGDLNIFLVILSGTIGALIGALFNYVLAYTVGRKVIYALAETKIAKMMFINSEKVEHAEKYFLENGKTSTFIGRLIPGIRHLISIPAGLAKMKLRDFILFTFLGAAIWNIILALLGYFLYSQKELLEKYFKELSIILLILGIIFIIFLIFKFLYKKKTPVK